ncbi:hypothetical protein WJX73_008766 [Symbiochloris irregularis]|uniref:Glycosyltransferase family 32 protein n=1 Tax=Symbiochloris irregularis TaxID=706552 RepID=A0AAW1P6A6_9CHLO
MWTTGVHDYKYRLRDPKFGIKDSARQACAKHHQHWEIFFWDLHAMTAFVTEFYPWFLPIFLGYGKEINQADAVRPFILQKLGGVYLDLDTQCIKPMDISLQGGYDAIFQASMHEGLNNGMMASKPGLALWMDMVDLLKERAPWAEISSAAEADFEDADAEEEWESELTEEERQLRASPIWQTGPRVLTEALRRNAEPPFEPSTITPGGKFQWRGATVLVQELGSWFMPCWWQDKECRRKYEGHSSDLPDNVFGYHWFASTWG